MRWHNGLLVLAATVGVGLAGSTWSEAQTVTAKAAPYTFTLQPVDKDDTAHKVVESDELKITVDDKKFTDETTYSDLIKQAEEAAPFYAPLSYREALNSFSLLNNDQIGNSQLWGNEYKAWSISEHGAGTFSLANKLYENWKEKNDNSAQRYTLDTTGLENELSHEIGENNSTVNVPFSKSTVSMTIKVQTKSGITVGTIVVHGMPGETIDLKHSTLETALRPWNWGTEKYVFSTDTITFGEESDTNQTTSIRSIPEKEARSATIKYVSEDNTEVAKTKVIRGDDKSKEQTITSPTVEGHTLDQASVTVNLSELEIGTNQVITVKYKANEIGGGDNNGGGNGNETPGGGDENENGGTDVDNGNNGNGSGSGSGSGTAVTPFKIYGKQKLYRYTNPTFQNHQRVQAHAKKTRAHAPVFTVVKKTTSKNGAARYQLSDGSHVTANSKYVANLYWKSNSYKTLHVTNPKGVNVHRNTGLTSKVRHMKQGTAIKVAKVVKVGQTTRYQLPNGNYITGSKKYVSPTKPKTVQKVKAKTTVRVYKDVNLTKVAKTYKKGATIKVSGWDHSHGDKTHRSGVKRYKVAGGFITANSKYVKVVK
ncbi:DUF5776 domain-containing protein [Levilactobacillus yonginensis]